MIRDGSTRVPPRLRTTARDALAVDPARLRALHATAAPAARRGGISSLRHSASGGLGGLRRGAADGTSRLGHGASSALTRVLRLLGLGAIAERRLASPSAGSAPLPPPAAMAASAAGAASLAAAAANPAAHASHAAMAAPAVAGATAAAAVDDLPPTGELRRVALPAALRIPLPGSLRIPGGLALPGAGRLRVPAAPRTRRLYARFSAMQLRNKLTVLALVPLILIGGWLLLRDSGLFSIDRVTISGLDEAALPIVTDELLAAAHSQTTTDFSVGALRKAVAPYTVIAAIHAQTHFPHGLTLDIVERHPIAHLQVGKRWFLLDAQGHVVTGASGRGLTALRSTAAPAGGRTSDAFVLVALHVLAAAPAVLRERVAAVTVADRALTIYLHRGPRLIFGNGALAHAKWEAAAAVLANPGSRGAAYVDVQVPSRPAAQVADPATTSSTGGGAPTGAASVSTLLDPALLQPSTYTSG